MISLSQPPELRFQPFLSWFISDLASTNRAGQHFRSYQDSPPAIEISLLGMSYTLFPPFPSACPDAGEKKQRPLCFAAAGIIGLARRGGIKVFSRGRF